MNVHEHDCGCGRLPSAAPSPRIECGVLMWYAGNTFELTIPFTLRDRCPDMLPGEPAPIHFGEVDSVEVIFSKVNGKHVKTFSFPAEGEEIENDTVTLEFDETVTALFGRGEYMYDVDVTVGGFRTTVGNDNRVVVL